MATFRNRQTGENFQVDDDQTPYFAAHPLRYEPVDVHPCPECDRTFDTAQGLASHSRTHDE